MKLSVLLCSTIFISASITLSQSVQAFDDDGVTLNWGGRIQADYLFVDDDELQHLDGDEIRRARLYISGQLSSQWDYKAQYDFKGDGEWKDLYLGYKASPNLYVQMGQIFEMVSLEGFTSSKNLTFIERSLPVAFVPDRALGVSMTYANENWMFATGVYGQNLRDTDISTFGSSARLAWSTTENDNIWHLGASVAYREPDNDSYRVRTRPETHVTDTRLVDTGTLNDVSSYSTQGLEFAWVRGSWSLQSEMMRQNIQRSTNSNLSVNSWYMLSSYFLTGEQRNYSQKWGVFSSTKPIHDYGAVELGLRYSQMDLNDSAVLGGAMENWTLGANWYISSQLKLAVNYIFSHAEKGTVIDKPQLAQIRLQYVF